VNLQDQPVSLCQFRGKVLLIVNTANECGYTPQYDGLENCIGSIATKVRDSRLSGKRFRRPGPGSNAEIAQFCRLNYGVTFPMFAKTCVVGANAKPALSRACSADRKAATLELPQVPPRPGGSR
jgi:glutathione peroxidase